MSINCRTCRSPIPDPRIRIEVTVWDAEEDDHRDPNEIPIPDSKEYLFHTRMTYDCLAAQAAREIAEETGKRVTIDTEKVDVILGNLQWQATLADEIEEGDVSTKEKLNVYFHGYMTVGEDSGNDLAKAEGGA
ncbi:hypothetical protein PHISCL_10084 [Aspergillus sclerotialis]|uniref:Uncharacterized protein n=1 Tax=Aspergillus sclerotialis TaxID=2070753 RepID=A0A3A2Z3H0_9EURO|nr:hypothetical protein PHISCL_10084 [Aspergillus sclerotialis]